MQGPRLGAGLLYRPLLIHVSWLGATLGSGDPSARRFFTAPLGSPLNRLSRSRQSPFRPQVAPPRGRAGPSEGSHQARVLLLPPAAEAIGDKQAPRRFRFSLPRQWPDRVKGADHHYRVLASRSDHAWVPESLPLHRIFRRDRAALRVRMTAAAQPIADIERPGCGSARSAPS